MNEEFLTEIKRLVADPAARGKAGDSDGVAQV
jgi:hypothetical protein